jgi:hypothetical protein
MPNRQAGRKCRRGTDGLQIASFVPNAGWSNSLRVAREPMVSSPAGPLVQRAPISWHVLWAPPRLAGWHQNSLRWAGHPDRPSPAERPSSIRPCEGTATRVCLTSMRTSTSGHFLRLGSVVRCRHDLVDRHGASAPLADLTNDRTINGHPAWQPVPLGAQTPEVPVAVLLPPAAVALLDGAVSLERRRQPDHEVDITPAQPTASNPTVRPQLPCRPVERRRSFVTLRGIARVR